VCYPKKVMQTHDDEENAREEFLKELPSRTWKPIAIPSLLWQQKMQRQWHSTWGCHQRSDAPNKEANENPYMPKDRQGRTKTALLETTRSIQCHGDLHHEAGYVCTRTKIITKRNKIRAIA
jgi:hypothetical protein